MEIINLKLSAFLLTCSIVLLSARGVEAQQTYQPIESSLEQHQVPEWYDDAKLGIFIHWGLYSVPAWAPLTGELGAVSDSVWFKHNPYAEWYLNTLRIQDSPTSKHHKKVYGEDFNYYNFASEFNKELTRWDPSQMASLFKEVHARYVVLTTKHHDGYLLWPSHYLNPHLDFNQRHTERDVVGDLTNAVREEGMRMGLYYSGGIDWASKPVVTTDENFGEATPQTKQYADYADAHWRELIDRYQPDVLWNDITYPDQGEVYDIFADYYNENPDGVVNNRWGREVHDFTTPEYHHYDEITTKKWEATRGIAFSFGYNQRSTEEQMLSVNELVDTFVNIVSKNGNLLLNVGPKADGTIPEMQAERLRGLGNWLDVNGEAIFGTRPWLTAESETERGVPVRFTFKEGTTYAILLTKPEERDIFIPDLKAADETAVRLLGYEGELQWHNQTDGITIEIPSSLEDSPAYTIVFNKQPSLAVKK